MKKILLGMFFFVSLMLCFSFPAWALIEDLDAANAAYRQGRYDEAIRLYTKVIEYRVPDIDELTDIYTGDKVEAYVNRGHCWMKKGNYDLGIADYTQALSRAYGKYGTFNRAPIRYARGRVYYLMGD